MAKAELVERVALLIEEGFKEGSVIHLKLTLRERGGRERKEIYTFVRSAADPNAIGLFDEDDTFMWAIGFNNSTIDWRKVAEGALWAVELFTRTKVVGAEVV